MKLFSFRPLLFVLIILISQNCISPPKKVHFMGEAQGTYYAVTYFDGKGRNLQPDIDSILAAFDQTASMWQPASLITRMNNDDTSVKVNEWFKALFNLSRDIGDQTGGAFDMTIGPLVNAWGFGFSGRIKMDSSRVDSLRQLVDYRKVHLDEGRVIKEIPGMHFDFNGIAQGFSVDVVARFIEGNGISNYLVDIGGEVLAKGRKPDGSNWTVGIENPVDNAQYGQSLNAVVTLSDKALATSGNYRKFYEEDGIRYSHTIDPKTGYPVRHNLLSVSVLADDCASADGYATAFMVMGREEAMQFLSGRSDLQAYFIESTEDGIHRVTYTKGFGPLIR